MIIKKKSDNTIITKQLTIIDNKYYLGNEKINPRLYIVIYNCSSCNKEISRPLNCYNELCKTCLAQKTKLEKYGSKNYVNSNKAKQTNLQKYGNKNYVNSDKRKQTNLKKYGVENPYQSSTIKEKIKKTNLKKYGNEYYQSINEFKEKISNFMKNNSNIVEKRKKAMLEKYGVENSMMIQEIKEKNQNARKNNIINNIFNGDRIKNKNIIPLFKKDEYIGSKEKYKWLCKTCNTEFYDYISDGFDPRCPTCNPWGSSSYEKEVQDFLNNNNIQYLTNDRTIIPPYEVDIYIPSYNLAIEINGLYWHSDIYKEKEYHRMKTNLCEEKNIKLVHIFEDELEQPKIKKIVFNRLKNMLGLNSTRIGARQCEIKEIDSTTKNKFLDTYHIQGKDGSRIKLGAFFNNQLIGVMTFSKPRLFMNMKNKKEGSWELSRFATINDTYTPGLASKMLKYFEKNYEWESIYSYADRRWSQGNLYQKIGFKFDSITNPNYFYFLPDKRIRKHRYMFRKSELKSFPNYSDDKTEHEIMNEAGWLRIYDCGNYKYIKQKELINNE